MLRHGGCERRGKEAISPHGSATVRGVPMIRPAAMLTFFALLSPAAASAADVAAGQAIFARCKICHNVQAGAPNTVGPNLHGVFGRKAGAAENFNYSAAMKESGVVWDDDTIRKYLNNPKDFVAGNKMAFPGIKNEDEISNLLAYLHEAAK
jgi:cytochrome c